VDFSLQYHERHLQWRQAEAAQQHGVAWEVEKLEAIENDRPAVLLACVSQETDHVDQEDHMT
jgi:hypothetical protein